MHRTGLAFLRSSPMAMALASLLTCRVMLFMLVIIISFLALYEPINFIYGNKAHNKSGKKFALPPRYRFYFSFLFALRFKTNFAFAFVSLVNSFFPLFAVVYEVGEQAAHQFTFGLTEIGQGQSFVHLVNPHIIGNLPTLEDIFLAEPLGQFVLGHGAQIALAHFVVDVQDDFKLLDFLHSYFLSGSKAIQIFLGKAHNNNHKDIYGYYIGFAVFSCWC